MSDTIKKLYNLFNPGQIKVGRFSIYSVKPISVNQVLEIDGVKYRIVMTTELQPFRNKHIMGYSSYAEYYQH